jgi:hypothetical protein
VGTVAVCLHDAGGAAAFGLRIQVGVRFADGEFGGGRWGEVVQGGEPPGRRHLEGNRVDSCSYAIDVKISQLGGR